MTEQERQEIIDDVIVAIRTNSKTINQLTPITTLADNDALEVSGGRYIRYSHLKTLFQTLTAEKLNELRDSVAGQVLVSVSIAVNGSVATLTIVGSHRTISCKIPLATTTRAGLMSASDKSLLNRVNGYLPDLAPLIGSKFAIVGPDGKLPESAIPQRFVQVVRFGSVKYLISVKKQSFDGSGSVVFDNNSGTFVFEKAGEFPAYYENWPTRQDYFLSLDTLYVAEADRMIYVWDGRTMVPAISLLQLGYFADQAFPGDDGARLAERLTQAERNIAGFTPIQIESESDLEELREQGLLNENALYFIEE